MCIEEHEFADICRRFQSMAGKAKMYWSGAADDYLSKYGFSDAYDKSTKRTYYKSRDECGRLQEWASSLRFQGSHVQICDQLQILSRALTKITIDRKDWFQAEELRQRTARLMQRLTALNM